MTNATDFKTNSAYEAPYTEVLTPNADNEVELAFNPIDDTVSISGLEEVADTVVSGKFKVTKASGETPAKITFFAGDVENDVTISYFYSVEAKEANIDNRQSAIGEAVKYCSIAA